MSVLGNRMAILGFVFITNVLISRYLGPDGKGVLAALLIYPTLLVSMSELGIRQASIYIVGKKEHTESKIIGVILFFLVLMSVVSIIAISLIFIFLRNPAFNESMIILALMIVPLMLCISYSQGVFLGKEQITNFVRTSWIASALELGFIVLLVVYANQYIIGALTAKILGLALVAFYALWLISKIAPIKINLDIQLAKKMLHLGIVYGIALFVLNLNYKVDIILLDLLSNPFELGQYTVGVTIAELIWQLPTALSLLVFSKSANAIDPRTFSKDISKLMRVVLVFAIVGAVTLFFASSYLIPLLFGSEFIPSVEVMQLLLPGIVIMTIFKVLNMDLAGKGKPFISLVVFAPVVVLNIALNFLLIPLYGSNGAAIASSLSYTIGGLLFLVVYARVVDISIKEMFKYQKADFKFIDIIFHGVTKGGSS